MTYKDGDRLTRDIRTGIFRTTTEDGKHLYTPIVQGYKELGGSMLHQEKSHRKAKRALRKWLKESRSKVPVGVTNLPGIKGTGDIWDRS